MAKTIVQDYGPIYGEPVNGTVQGRPNGSVYVPLSNTIVLSLEEDYRYFRPGSTNYFRVCDSAGVSASTEHGFKISANSQDLSSYMQIQLYSDSDLSALFGYKDFTSGIFNVQARDVVNGDKTGLEDGMTIYLRAQLMNNAVAVATSNVIECEYVVVE